MTREEKDLQIKELTQMLADNSVLYLTDASGLNAEETTQLRRACYKNDVCMRVVKNTLLRRAMEASEGTDFSELYEVLSGQTALLVGNVGNAPASGLFLKTNLPWIDIVDNEISSSDKCMTTEEKESRAISRCLGPSGTLMSIPVKGNIDPNQTFDIQVRVRTSGEKKQDFYMLYKYDIVTNLAEKDSKRRSRWLRKMYEVPVFPSLTFNVSPLNTTFQEDEVLVAVELTNDRLDRPTDLYITLDHLSLVSRRYKLKVLPGQFTRSEDFGDVLQIGWQEKVTVFYGIVVPEVESQIKTCLMTECKFSETGNTYTKECASSTETNYLCLTDAFASFQVREASIM